MRLALLAVLTVGCSSRGWPTVGPAPRDDLTAEQGEAYRALAHGLSNFMNARADDIEVDIELALILEEVLLHARAVDDDDWRKARTGLEVELGARTVPDETVVDVRLDGDAPWRDRWEQDDQLSGEPALDEIIRTHDIRVVETGVLVEGYFDLIVPREVNGYALANLIAEVPGIGSPVPGWDSYAWGNGFSISQSVFAEPSVVVRPDARHGGWSLRVVLGWGDCAAGCIYAHTFEFEIDSDGDTRLVGAQGTPLPPTFSPESPAR